MHINAEQFRKKDDLDVWYFRDLLVDCIILHFLFKDVNCTFADEHNKTKTKLSLAHENLVQARIKGNLATRASCGV
jgi:hypothetical protein